MGQSACSQGKSVRPRRSLVGILNFESRTPFYGWTTPSGGLRAAGDNGALPPGDGDENWARGVAGFFPPLHDHKEQAAYATERRGLHTISMANLAKKITGVRWGQARPARLENLTFKFTNVVHFDC